MNREAETENQSMNKEGKDLERPCERKSKRSVSRPDLQPSSIISNHWNTEDIAKVLSAIREHGHLNYDEILRAVPGKTVDQYKNFLRAAKKLAKESLKSDPQLNNCTDWMQVCETQYVKHRASHAKLELHLLLKLLSIDGVLENHPLPEDAGGVDYAACYRLLHQAVLGHPIQPINEATAAVIYGVIDEISAMVEQGESAVNNLKEILLQKFAVATPDVSESSVSVLHHSKQAERTIKTYQRKTAVSSSIVKKGLGKEVSSLNGTATTPAEKVNKPLAEASRRSSNDIKASSSGLADVHRSTPDFPAAEESLKFDTAQDLMEIETTKTTLENTFNKNTTSEICNRVKLNVREDDRSSGDESFEMNRVSNLRPQSKLRVYQRHKPESHSTPLTVGIEHKILRDVGLNPLQLPVNMLFNVNHSYDKNKTKAIKSQKKDSKLMVTERKEF